MHPTTVFTVRLFEKTLGYYSEHQILGFRDIWFFPIFNFFGVDNSFVVT